MRTFNPEIDMQESHYGDGDYVLKEEAEEEIAELENRIAELENRIEDLEEEIKGYV